MATAPAAIDFPSFDADNHYYEAEDAFIRHLDPSMRKRCMQWAEIDGKKRLLVGGRVNRFIPNPTFDPVAHPGVLDSYFRAKTSAKDIREAFGQLEPISPFYRDRQARLTSMDDQGVEACFMSSCLDGPVDEPRHLAPHEVEDNDADVGGLR